MVGIWSTDCHCLCALLILTAHVRRVVALSAAARGGAALDRRDFARRVPIAAAFFAGSSGAAAGAKAATTSSTPIAARFDADALTAPPVTAGARTTGHDNLAFPPWMEGEWEAEQTLVSVKAPLGLKFLGGPNASLDVARKSMDEQTKRLNEPVRLALRFVRTNFGVVEDKAFNTKSRLDSFAGKSVVASVEYADTNESNRAAVLAAGGAASDPLSTTLVYFKGPAAQKTFVVSRGGQTSPEGGGDRWSGYELNRSIFALTNQSTAPPVTTDTEVLYSLTRVADDAVEGRLRLAAYLNPQADQLYFESKNRAVSLNDYTLSLRRKKTVVEQGTAKAVTEL